MYNTNMYAIIAFGNYPLRLFFRAKIKVDYPISDRHPVATCFYADRPRFSLSEKKMSIRQSLRTSTSASSSSACRNTR